jgi:hypothetical protein
VIESGAVGASDNAEPDETGEQTTELADPTTSPWPTRPGGCPPSTAERTTGTYLRLVDGSEEDWQLPIQINGPLAEATAEKECMNHAFSVFATLDGAQTLRKRVKRFTLHRVARVTMTHEYGVLLMKNSAKSSHCSWWPEPTFVAPPPYTMVEE